MSKLIEDVFIVIGFLILAVLAYQFAFKGFDGGESGIRMVANAVEKPLSRFYYEYCYIPTISAYSYVDETLGITTYDDNNLFSIKAENYSESYSTSTFTGRGGLAYWGTGWE